MQEEWKAVVGLEGLYEVSNMGNIRSLRNARCFRGYVPYYDLHQTYNKHTGYMQTYFKINGKCICRNVHRLVAEAFLPNPNNYPVINHKDRNRTNNNVDNLEWCTQKYNVNYQGAQSSKYKSVCMMKGSIVINTFDSITHAIDYLRSKGLSKAVVCAISWACNGKRNSAYGYEWRYKEGV